MKQQLLLIADSGPIISLALLDKLDLLTILFDEVCIPSAVWDELRTLRFTEDFPHISVFFRERVKSIHGENYLLTFTDYGESEAMLLYKELHAAYLLIDDKKARAIAEELDITCIGTIGLLYRAKEKHLIQELRPLFLTLLNNKRYYAIAILNKILEKAQEETIV